MSTLTGWSYLDNGTVKVGLDLDLGGCLAYLSASGSSSNLLQDPPSAGGSVQPSYWGADDEYSEGFYDSWGLVGWNPIQAGQSGSGHDNTNVQSENFTSNGVDAAYLKVRMVQWRGESVPAYDSGCWLEQWVTLSGPVVKVRYRCTYDGECGVVAPMDRCPDEGSVFGNNGLEAPAVYVNGSLKTFWGYQGVSPWTAGTLSSWTTITTWDAYGRPVPALPEKWVAINAGGSTVGVGIYAPDCYGFALNPFDGAPGSTYATPVLSTRINVGAVFEHEAYFTVGTPAEIRAAFAAVEEDPVPENLLLFDRGGTSERWLQFHGVAGAQGYRVYRDGQRWPDAATEFTQTFLGLGENPIGLFTVSAVLAGVEGLPSDGIVVTLEDIFGGPVLGGNAYDPFLVVVDSAQGAEALLRAVGVHVADAGTAAEALLAGASLRVTDQGVSAETLAGRVSLSVTDQGAGAESLLAATPTALYRALLDAGFFVEALTIDRAGTADPDVAIAVSDAGFGVEVVLTSSAIVLTPRHTFDAKPRAFGLVAADRPFGFSARNRVFTFAARARDA